MAKTTAKMLDAMADGKDNNDDAGGFVLGERLLPLEKTLENRLKNAGNPPEKRLKNA